MISRVDPKTPPLATLTKVGGTVKVHIVIAASGDVASATAVSGPPVLFQAATDAVKQWKFRPFLGGTTPIAAASDVEVTFPGGLSESESNVNQKFFGTENECRSLMQASKFAEAEPKCRDAVEISHELPKDAVLERSGALSMLANAIFSQRRFNDAIPFYEQALELDRGYLKPEDADLASDCANLGRAYAVTGSLSKADELYAKAVATFRDAIKDLPSMSENYSRRLKRALNEYAQIKDAEGQSEAASALREQAGEVNP